MVTILLGVVMLFTACLKEDEKVTPHEPGNAVQVNYNMGNNYTNQFYFNLESNSIMGQNLKTAWDLGFDTRQGNYSIIVNGAKFCKAADTGFDYFAQVNDTAGANWQCDANSGNLDSTAIGTWGAYNADTAITTGRVYILDRGYDEQNNHIGFIKFKIIGAGANYYINYTTGLNNNDSLVATISRTPGYNFSYFSFNGNGTQVYIEPTAGNWDLIFTQYVYIYHTVDYPNYPYLVTGVLLNRQGVTAAADSANTYESITLADTANYNFTAQQDIIGYDWKYYDFDEGKYNIKPGKNYIIRSRNGLYYKMRFIDFYVSGIKGNVLLEFQQL